MFLHQLLSSVGHKDQQSTCIADNNTRIVPKNSFKSTEKLPNNASAQRNETARTSSPDLQRHREIIRKLRREEQLGILLVADTAAQRNAVDLAVHDAICERFGREDHCVCWLATQREGGEAATVGLQSLAAVLFNAVELHEPLDEVGPAYK
jgi:hypothetical protein